MDASTRKYLLVITMSKTLAEFENFPPPFDHFPSRTFRAYCMEVIDGDTFRLLVDIGFYNFSYVTIRLLDVDTPEIFSPHSPNEFALGMRAKEKVQELIEHKQVIIATKKDATTLGRFVAVVSYWNGIGWSDLGTTLKTLKLTKSDII